MWDRFRARTRGASARRRARARRPAAPARGTARRRRAGRPRAAPPAQNVRIFTTAVFVCFHYYFASAWQLLRARFSRLYRSRLFGTIYIESGVRPLLHRRYPLDAAYREELHPPIDGRRPGEEHAVEERGEHVRGAVVAT